MSIDWEVNRLARNRFSQGHQRFYIKYVTGQIGNQHTLHYRKQVDSPNCPNCSHPEERSSHTPQCSNAEARANTLKLIDKNIKKELEERNTFAPLKDAILTILGNWCKGLPIAASLFDSIFGLRDAVAEKTEIGWNNFWVGRWLTKWQVVQKRYYKSINSKKSSRRWATAIVYKCILTAWDVWQFRNNLVHGPRGVKERALHASLDEEIRDQLAIGYDDLLHQEKVFFQGKKEELFGNLL